MQHVHLRHPAKCSEVPREHSLSSASGPAVTSGPRHGLFSPRVMAWLSDALLPRRTPNPVGGAPPCTCHHSVPTTLRLSRLHHARSPRAPASVPSAPVAARPIGGTLSTSLPRPTAIPSATSTVRASTASAHCHPTPVGALSSIHPPTAAPTCPAAVVVGTVVACHRFLAPNVPATVTSPRLLQLQPLQPKVTVVLQQYWPGSWSRAS